WNLLHAPGRLEHDELRLQLDAQKAAPDTTVLLIDDLYVAQPHRLRVHRVRVRNVGAIPAEGVRLRLLAITPAPRSNYVGDFPYPFGPKDRPEDYMPLSINAAT